MGSLLVHEREFVAADAGQLEVCVIASRGQPENVAHCRGLPLVFHCISGMSAGLLSNKSSTAQGSII